MTKVYEIWFTRLPILGRSLTTIACSLVCDITDQKLLEGLSRRYRETIFPIHELKLAFCFAETVSESMQIGLHPGAHGS
jgi:hypothetical protein